MTVSLFQNIFDSCYFFLKLVRLLTEFKDALRILTGKKTPSNKTLAHTESRNMGIWVVGISNQLFIRGS